MHFRCNRHGLQLAPGSRWETCSGQMYLGLNFSSILFEADLKLTVAYHDSVWFTCSGQFKMIGGMLYPNICWAAEWSHGKKNTKTWVKLGRVLIMETSWRQNTSGFTNNVWFIGVSFFIKVPEPLGEWAGHCSCKVTETVFWSSNPAQIQSLGSRCEYVQVRPWEKPFTFQVAEAWICCGVVGKPKDEKLGQSQISQRLYSLQWWPSCIKRRPKVRNLWKISNYMVSHNHVHKTVVFGLIHI